MNSKLHFIIGSVSALAAAGLLLPAAASGQAAQVEDVRVLTRGPVHEAFAESVSFDPVAGVIISAQVPEAIEELPPEQQLEGDNVTWIPGYWAWDDDQNDFIWISGIWRNLPPGRQWVPGYWNDIGGGRSQWTSGYWADANVTEVSYVSTAPPRSIDSGPNIVAPSPRHSWVPGHWFWLDFRYVWRPGYWVALRTDWTWVPSRYTWTRRGYVYIDGYWDYAVARRGVLFAPVYFHRHVLLRPNYYYTPSIVVAAGVFSSHLFVRPLCGHYYFGDYYAPRYRDAGYYASFSWHAGRRGYDPIHAYDRWCHRDDRGWEQRRYDDYNYYRDHEKARPPHTWAAMKDWRDERFNDGRNRGYATSLATYAQDARGGQRFRAVDEGRRKQIVSQRQEMRKFGQERRQLESRGTATGERFKEAATRERIARSPIRGREAERFARNEAPPARPEVRAEQSRKAAPARTRPEEGLARKDRTVVPSGSDRRMSTRDHETRATGKTAVPGPNRDAIRGINTRPQADRPAGAGTKAPSSIKAPERKTQPRTELRPMPGNKQPNAPGRVVQPQPQGRENLPKPAARPLPERKPQVSPRREIQPTPQIRKAPQPKVKARPLPERKPQVSPRREIQPTPQIRQAPQPRVQSRPVPERSPQAVPKRVVPERQVRQEPQRRMQPGNQAPDRRTASSRPTGNPEPREKSANKRNKDSKE